MSADVVSSIRPGSQYRITVDQYQQMIDSGLIAETARVELIEGVIVEMSPQSEAHACAVSVLLRILIRGLDDSWVVRSQAPRSLGRSAPEPDVAVVAAGSVATATRHPATAPLVIEVARSSIGLDRAMAAVYAEAAVSEYWIVDIDHRCVEVYREPAGDEYRTRMVHGEDESLRSSSFPALLVPIAALFQQPRH